MEKVGAKWGILIGILIGVAITLSALAIYNQLGDRRDQSEAERISSRFVEAMRRQDSRGAYELFALALRARQSREDIDRAFKLNETLLIDSTYERTDCRIDRDAIEINGKIVLSNKSTIPIWFELVPENGAWRIHAYKVGV